MLTKLDKFLGNLDRNVKTARVGCASFASGWGSSFLVAGRFRPGARPPKSIRRSGAAASPVRAVSGDQHDAYSIARADRNANLAAFLKPDFTPPEQRLRRWKAGY